MEMEDKKHSVQGKFRENWRSSIKKFHEGRTIKVTNVVSEIEENDLKTALSFLSIKSIEINRISQIATIILCEPESFDPLLCNHEIPAKVKDRSIHVKYSTKDDFLCISNLPSTFTDCQFSELVNKFGPVTNYFLIYDHKSDENKGYGLVQYCSRAVACQARNLIHGKEIKSGILHCDWLDHRILKYSDLYSKCLYVDNLPLNYCNLGDFRKIFSCEANPLYCQLAFINGQAVGFGLIEYNISKEAEITSFKLKNYELKNKVIRISLASPAIPAIKLHDKLIADIKKKKVFSPLLSMPVFSVSTFPQIKSQESCNLYQRIFQRNQINQNNLKPLQILQPVFLQPQTTAKLNNLCAPYKTVETYSLPQTPLNLFQLDNVNYDYLNKVLGKSTFYNQNRLLNTDMNYNKNNSLIFKQERYRLNNFNVSKENYNGSAGFFNTCKPLSPNNSVNLQESFPFQKRINYPVLSISNIPTTIINNNAYKSPGTAVQGGCKRKLKLLPSPECSPENNYIGQHSQGIGGHYAESYFKKKLKSTK
ncbi:ribonucleoprotein PTB-binding 1-like [Centruroides vittatus]|uniref:ribonucleoprotein PTB-binding 1-like n=1 Tax=Centruroides vittatus TaxID=120091 RepID=UPI00351094EE